MRLSSFRAKRISEIRLAEVRSGPLSILKSPVRSKEPPPQGIIRQFDSRWNYSEELNRDNFADWIFHCPPVWLLQSRANCSRAARRPFKGWSSSKPVDPFSTSKNCIPYGYFALPPSIDRLSVFHRPCRIDFERNQYYLFYYPLLSRNHQGTFGKSSERKDGEEMYPVNGPCFFKVWRNVLVKNLKGSYFAKMINIERIVKVTLMGDVPWDEDSETERKWFLLFLHCFVYCVSLHIFRAIQLSICSSRATSIYPLLFSFLVPFSSSWLSLVHPCSFNPLKISLPFASPYLFLLFIAAARYKSI